MSIVSQTYAFVVGVDTHDKRVYAIINTTTGEHLDTRDFPTTTAGIQREIAWVGKRTGGDAETLWVIEGVASYGAVLAGAITSAGYQVAEAPRMSAKAHHGVGKSDLMDAHRIATAALPLHADQLRTPRLNDGVRAALRVLITARESLTVERTSAVNALTALLRVTDLGMDARKAYRKSSRFQSGVNAMRTWPRPLPELKPSEAAEGNATRITELVAVSEAAPLLNETGFGPVTAAVCLTTWSHQGRVRSEAAYASLSGVNPIPASSGNTVRHRLNRGGDRRLNKALHTVAMVRMAHEEMKTYTDKRTQEGRTTREICRWIKTQSR